MGRKRIPEEEKKITVAINLKRKIVDKIAEKGKPKHVIEKIIEDKYGKD